jgi:hypothetical protein
MQRRTVVSNSSRSRSLVGRDVTIDAELVEQRFLHHGPLAHHHFVLPTPGTTESELHTDSNADFSTVSAQSCRQETRRTGLQGGWEVFKAKAADARKVDQPNGPVLRLLAHLRSIETHDHDFPPIILFCGKSSKRC